MRGTRASIAGRSGETALKETAETRNQVRRHHRQEDLALKTKVES